MTRKQLEKAKYEWNKAKSLVAINYTLIGNTETSFPFGYATVATSAMRDASLSTGWLATHGSCCGNVWQTCVRQKYYRFHKTSYFLTLICIFPASRVLLRACTYLMVLFIIILLYQKIVKCINCLVLHVY